MTAHAPSPLLYSTLSVGARSPHLAARATLQLQVLFSPGRVGRHGSAQPAPGPQRIHSVTATGLYRYDGLHFRGYTTADGLPDTGIESLHETASGILLVGTQKGLARLDGETFKAIPIPGMPAISSQQSLTSDPLGLLYVSTSQGLFIGLLAGAAYSFHLRCLLAVQRPTDCSLIPWARCGSAVVLVCALLPRMERKFSGVRLWGAAGSLGRDPGRSGRQSLDSQSATRLRAAPGFGEVRREPDHHRQLGNRQFRFLAPGSARTPDRAH